jgi:hypothetical protein
MMVQHGSACQCSEWNSIGYLVHATTTTSATASALIRPSHPAYSTSHFSALHQLGAPLRPARSLCLVLDGCHVSWHVQEHEKCTEHAQVLQESSRTAAVHESHSSIH